MSGLERFSRPRAAAFSVGGSCFVAVFTQRHGLGACPFPHRGFSLALSAVSLLPFLYADSIIYPNEPWSFQSELQIFLWTRSLCGVA